MRSLPCCCCLLLVLRSAWVGGALLLRWPVAFSVSHSRRPWGVGRGSDKVVGARGGVVVNKKKYKLSRETHKFHPNFYTSLSQGMEGLDFFFDCGIRIFEPTFTGVLSQGKLDFPARCLQAAFLEVSLLVPFHPRLSEIVDWPFLKTLSWGRLRR